ncbi:hypothetical protein FHS95_000121 [Sphingomonas naasensis]|uniref:Uncharacterized protein n=1 Tax=Sphingomonas naasensis TaxID=1344951 RepID=A0A4S1WVV8_9SPHN|nr:hypothetical protein [Sphingomonas naasensis]NIJ18452.1 hypothetical protein [Sphingomonas naasensis]TGX45716.1 hypothetical protein E5A74_00600 [Sphingomonas naasensis]
MTEIHRQYDADGFRRIRPSERSPGLVELRLPNGRCVACVGFGARVERAVAAKAKALPPLPVVEEETAA